MKLEDLNSVYFVGIGGIGMSALARFFHDIGKHVAGYDRTETTLTRRLAQEGMCIHYEDDLSLIPKEFTLSADHKTILVVYTPAVPETHKELTYFKNAGYTVMKRAQVLGLITHSYHGVAVAGSHGKSTVTAMTANIFEQSKAGCSAFLGAISKNADSNLILNSDSPWAIMEADEFDRSFLHLEPSLSLVTSMDPDHLDIYGGTAYLKTSFEDFLAKSKPGSSAVIKYGLNLKSSADNGLKYYSYHLDQEADFYARNIRSNQLGYCFDFVHPKGVMKDFEVVVPGWINVENAVAAAALAWLAGLEETDIRRGIQSFAGVKRRFDIRYQSAKRIYLDDYAHHPKEIKALIESVRRLFPLKRIAGVFQPHLFTRTRDFASDFALELGKLDELLLMPIYPAREEPIDGVRAEMILDRVEGIPAEMVTRQELVNRVLQKEWDVLLSIGAGDIDNMVEPIEKALNEMDS